MPETPITAGEVARGLQLIRGDIKELVKEVRDHPDWQDISRLENVLMLQIANEKAARTTERSSMEKAVKGLEDWNTWAQRIVLGALGTGIVGYLLTAALSV